jgi:hypothetical protein
MGSVVSLRWSREEEDFAPGGFPEPDRKVRKRTRNYQKGGGSQKSLEGQGDQGGEYFKNDRQAGRQWLMGITLAIWEAVTGRIIAWGQPRQRVHETPISKITRAKQTGGVIQGAECLLCKCEPLSSNPSPLHNKKFKNKCQMLLTNVNIY